MRPSLFFIAIMPNKELEEEVYAFKKYMASHFGAQHALKSPAHITLIPPFKWDLAKINPFQQNLTLFSKGHHRFQ